MPDRPPQSYANHARYLPGFHFFVLPVLLVNTIIAMVGLVRTPSLTTAWVMVVAIALLLGMFFARTMPLTVQNRVIRLEETLRLERLLPGRRAEIPGLSGDHLIGIRFASDAEVPALVDRIGTGELRTRKEIKRAITSWRADHIRA